MEEGGGGYQPGCLCYNKDIYCHGNVFLFLNFEEEGRVHTLEVEG